MKFKKSVSALAALTLSVTAFAGLAVTANAEELSLNYIGSAASEETFDSYTVSNGSWDTEFTTIGSAAGIGIQDLSSSTSTVYTSGNVLTSRRRGAGTSYFKYTVDHAVKAGKVYFSTSIDIGNGLDGS